MPSGTIAPFPKHQFFDNSGNPANGYKLFTYLAGTTTKEPTYSEVTLTTANANPIVLDSAGRATIFLSPTSYKFVLAPSTDSDPPVSPIWTQDNIAAVPITNVALDIEGTAGENLTANNVVFLSDGSGSLTAGRWYKTDSDHVYASVEAPAIGIVLTNLNSGVAGSIRTIGRATGLSALTAGGTYYVSPTAGALSAAPGNFVRPVGVADSTTSLVLTEKKNMSVRRVAHFVSTVGNVGAGEDILASYTASVSVLGELYATGVSYEGKFWGLTANNANAKTLRLRLIEGANDTVFISQTLTTSELGEWEMNFTLIRDSTTTGRHSTSCHNGPANGPVTRHANNAGTPTCTWANGYELRVTGEATTDNDITLQGGLIKIVPLGY